MTLAIIAPRMPPSIDGVGDYTQNLLDHFIAFKPQVIFVNDGSEGSRTSQPGTIFEVLQDNLDSLADKLHQYDIKVVILQYSGYGFHSRGCPTRLLVVLKNWRESNLSHRLVVMAHELWHGSPIWKPGYFYQRRHKQLLTSLLGTADCVFTSTDGYSKWLSGISSHTRIKTLPIGTNVIPVADRQWSTTNWQSGRWVLFGKQHGRIHGLRAFAQWIPRLFEAGKILSLEVVGSSESEDLSRQELHSLDRLLPRNAYCYHGTLNSRDLSRLFLDCSYGLFAQTPESYTKSTVFMAYASHGLAIVAPMQWPGSANLADWILYPDQMLRPDQYGVSPGQFAQLLHSWQLQNASWTSIANAYETVLQSFMEESTALSQRS